MCIYSFRWERPVLPKPWRPEVYNATALKPGCPQHGCFATNPGFVCPNQVLMCIMFTTTANNVISALYSFIVCWCLNELLIVGKQN